MNKRDITTAWSRFVAGEQLTDEETRAVEQAIAADPALRDELADDQQLHRMLSTMGPIHESQDAFVAGVVSACAGRDNPYETRINANHESHRPVRWQIPVMMTLAGCLFVAGLLFYTTLLSAKRAQERALAAEQEARQAAEQANAKAEELRAELERPVVADNSRIQPARPVVEQPLPEPPVNEPAQPAVGPAIATITFSDSATWETAPDGDAMPAGRFELKSGQVELSLPTGSRFELKGPSTFEIVNASHLKLDRGEVIARVAPEDLGFRVTTPNARVLDLGTSFRVGVDDAGETQVQMFQGEVVLIPGQPGVDQTRWHLKIGEYEEAVVSGPGDSKRGPLASRRLGPAGFKGEVRLAGHAMEFSSRDRFDRIKNSVNEHYAAAPQAAVSDWQDLSRMFKDTSGQVTIDGRQTSYDSLDSVMNIEESMVESGDASEVTKPRGNQVFMGTIVINGERRTFTSREEYEAVRKEMLKPLGRLGIRSPSESQRERDEQTNPFE